LVTNVISEVHASAGYIGIYRSVEEPVLKQLARHLAGDEARHATGFLAYARRAFERSDRKEREQLDAMKVLHMWLNANTSVQHPVNTVGLRTSGEQGLLDEWARSAADNTIVEQHSILQEKITRKRALGLVSNLTGIEVKGPEDVMNQIRILSRVAREASPS
jgi:hypothetical protein